MGKRDKAAKAKASNGKSALPARSAMPKRKGRGADGWDFGPNAKRNSTDPWRVPEASKFPNEKISFLNCWLRVWGIVLGICWNILRDLKSGERLKFGFRQSV